MLTSSKTLLTGALLIALVPLSSQAQVFKGDEDNFRLRCWQEGKLLFDLSGLEKPGASAKSTLTLAVDGKKIELFELNETTCLITQGELFKE